ncbi:ribulose-phosphate 3-epimerase [Staphylococcus schleiferi]|uniref:ribulose-phosphate 3-epimerase n=1 Tax=Staphylococcus coagulans TaxID=74706 RepID=UPI00067A19FE|nr:ribulose-phosphate 3-epimerase [Staphylococcus coagulans]AKS69477.1 ribulose-phosphate 3-epimerase [Staphylococcus schleiferi]AKS71647.1 ribulose-phosphate 3-epimerase [Staphylococcus schleiferi]AKS73882.1 ribulose-phosphate 3-epimerase [Staphylococcus schleiferi]MBT2809165.1 ribulose-phosphate 3-epimerase [Staphylococcus coagulans]MBT2811410.1 ribulose-phosphate 3-epimerase [Staphylococcus coagulans]
MTKIFPSLLSADFLNLKQEMIELERAGVDALHFDVMDGQFVPNISIGFPILEAVRSATSLPIDVHLMINNPEQYIDTFIDKGANKLSVHYEATPHIHRIVQRIKNRGVEAGVVINPGTPISALDTLLDEVDYVLIMSVNPGFGGQKFIQSSLRKIAQLKEQRNQRELDFKIEVDGGVNAETATQVIEAGADWLVAGSYFFNQQNYQQATQILKGEA